MLNHEVAITCFLLQACARINRLHGFELLGEQITKSDVPARYGDEPVLGLHNKAQIIRD